MNELNDEIKITINTMQCDIDDGAHGELQYHLMSILEIKRNELQQRLVERSGAKPAACVGLVVTHDQSPYKSVKLEGQRYHENTHSNTAKRANQKSWQQTPVI